MTNEGGFTFATDKPDGAPQKLLDVSRMTELGWTAQTALQFTEAQVVLTSGAAMIVGNSGTDSAGNTGVIYAGDAQWMTAGRGVIHNENPLPGTTTHALQLWVNLPASEKMAAPRYQDLRGADLPTRREPGVEIRAAPGAFRLRR